MTTTAGFQATIQPSFGEAGVPGTWVVQVRIGEAGIVTGAGVRIQLPDTWHVGLRNGAHGVHASEPSAPNFVSVRCSRAGATLICEVEDGSAYPINKSDRASLDGHPSFYAYVTRVTVTNGRLIDGDYIDFMYGDTSGGSVGYTAGYHPNGAERIRVAVDVSGTGEYELLPQDSSPLIEIMSTSAAEILSYIPSTTTVGETGLLRLVVVDEYGNRVTDFAGQCTLTADGAEVDLVDRVVFHPRDQGIVDIAYRALGDGILRIRVTGPNGLDAVSNPGLITSSVPINRLYWGDIHSHAHDSFDGVGNFPFEYARDVAKLDFYALTEHVERYGRERWDSLKDRVIRYNVPGEFVTLFAYEATFGPPWGHHNVYFADADGPIFGATDGTLIDLWNLLERGQALTIPHHTGVRFGRMPPGSAPAGGIPGGETPNPDWQYHDPEYRRLIEIYSGHGQSESYDPDHPISYENSLFSTNFSVQGPHYAVDAWRRGLRLGVVASSDDHRGQPGRGELGLTAVLAPALDRQDIFRALRQRRTYGTTGARIILDFTMDGEQLGGPSLAPRHYLSISVHGTDLIQKVDVIRCDLTAQTLTIAEQFAPGALDLVTVWSDPHALRYGFYYLRVKQRNSYRGRPVYAWSSPLWVELPDD